MPITPGAQLAATGPIAPTKFGNEIKHLAEMPSVFFRQYG
jgi:hypothetical protein